MPPPMPVPMPAPTPVPLQTLLINFAPDFWEHTWVESLMPGVALQYVTDAAALDDGRPTLVIVSDIDDLYGDAAATVLRRFADAGRPAGLMHLGDECYKCGMAHYGLARFVVRNYWRPYCPSGRDGVVHFVPLGTKSHFTEFLTPRPPQDRKYRWSFAGEIKGRRVKMHAGMSAVPGGHVFRTRQWDDPNALTTRQYAELMCESVFVPCPRGNESVDCFRVYEALEAGAIPLVEDDGRWAGVLDALHAPAALRHRRVPRGNAIYRSRMGVSYWDSLYGPDFPLPRVWDWSDAGRVMDGLDVPRVRAECVAWWDRVKQDTRARIDPVLTTLARSPD